MEVLIFIPLLGLYFLPVVIATARQHAQGPVFIINLFLGWTLIGWIVAMVWAVTEHTPAERARLKLR